MCFFFHLCKLSKAQLSTNANFSTRLCNTSIILRLPNFLMQELTSSFILSSRQILTFNSRIFYLSLPTRITFPNLLSNFLMQELIATFILSFTSFSTFIIYSSPNIFFHSFPPSCLEFAVQLPNARVDSISIFLHLILLPLNTRFLTSLKSSSFPPSSLSPSLTHFLHLFHAPR